MQLIINHSIKFYGMSMISINFAVSYAETFLYSIGCIFEMNATVEDLLTKILWILMRENIKKYSKKNGLWLETCH